MNKTIKIGSRTSLLAMTQTKLVIEQIKKVHSQLSFEIIPIQTLGDKILDKPLIEFGGKGVFVNEFEHALQNKTIDYAVHSAKDLPMQLADGLTLAGVPKREDPRDVLLTRKDWVKREDVPMHIGTGSQRRQLQISEKRNVTCSLLRGNVTTRLEKLRTGQLDGIILAAAGLKRLGLLHETDINYEYLPTKSFIPAGGQGILAVEGREGDPFNDYICCINEEDARLSLAAERTVLAQLEASCNMPVGVFSEWEKDKGMLSLFIQKEGVNVWRYQKGAREDYLSLAKQIVEELP